VPSLRVFEGGNMRAAMIAVALIATTLQAHAGDSTREFLNQYAAGDNIYSRLYIRGVGDGISVYNATQKGALFCPPEKIGIVDGQYVAIIRDFVAKVPKAMDKPVEVVLLYALKEAFPCKGQ
jgi:hypothetical protein